MPAPGSGSARASSRICGIRIHVFPDADIDGIAYSARLVGFRGAKIDQSLSGFEAEILFQSMRPKASHATAAEPYFRHCRTAPRLREKVYLHLTCQTCDRRYRLGRRSEAPAVFGAPSLRRSCRCRANPHPASHGKQWNVCDVHSRGVIDGVQQQRAVKGDREAALRSNFRGDRLR